MDIRQLRYFVAVAEEGQVTSAAKRLNMEQPPLSRQMKLLESELGVTLFDRSGKRLTLTHAGQLLRQRAEQLLCQFQETIEEVQELDEGVHGTLSIGSVVSCVSLLPQRIERFHELYPRVTFKINEGDHFLLGDQLEKRNLELIVARLPFEAASDPDRYTVIHLPPDPFVALIPSSWPQASEDRRLEMGEMAQYPFLSLKSDLTTGMHDRVLKSFRESGHEPHILCECSSVAIILALVTAGIGATILPKSVLASFPLTSIALYELSHTELYSEVGLIWIKDRYLSKSARNFIKTFEI
ncbi:LysR family transcriptional regulator [Paenibacillus barcinonensis]|uniref:DNA-binding transcriptional LysR family regulator n=1 Tax=Paenibacillus barcinonensis TaxID=198119 RepID=A0A2V4WE80_PAEBA|nr:LysR family transcriptional regulator [Paenibacillus barcinonensis]PYE45824.1 DNA-binding transcriptional LysR family regulator [Paenibacillus barcinonensis]QKS57100.1 LysR family transcriptional regulator [Paenibacillus barcinonensis]